MHVCTRPRLALLALALCSTGIIPAQQTAPTSPAAGRMVLDVVVAPKSGAPVSGLQQQDFTILDNKTPQKIASFAALGGPEAPIEIVLVFDLVNTDLQTATYARTLIDKFLKDNDGHLPYPTTLAIFNDAGMSMGDNPTKDGNELSSVFDKTNLGLRDTAKFSGPTGEADKLHMCLVATQRLVMKEATRPGRKIILWVSPGWPLLSAPNLNYDAQQGQQLFRQTVVISTQLRRAGVTIYNIDPSGTDAGNNRFIYEQFLNGATKPSQTVPGYMGLQVLAIQTGGQVLTGNNDIAVQLKKCMADFTSYYELSYDLPPDERRDDYHTVQIKVSQPGLVARARTGYYVQP